MIKNIIFDFGNVVVRFKPQEIVSKVTTDIDEQKLLVDAVFGEGRFEDTDRGLVNADEHKAQVRALLPKHLHNKSDRLIDVWYLDLPVNDGFEQLLLDCKKSGYKIFLLSNINIQFAENVDNVPILKLFDGLLLSSQVKHIKPEKEIYLSLLNKFSLKAEECLFVDDRAINIDGGEKVGIKGYLFDGNVDKLKNYINTNCDMFSKI